MDLRCDHILHGIIDGNQVEFKCRSSRCGAGPGLVVLHRFDLVTGKLVNTRKFRSPDWKERQ